MKNLRCEVFRGYDIFKLGEDIDLFLIGRELVDIKYQSTLTSEYSVEYSALVIYRA